MYHGGLQDVSSADAAAIQADLSLLAPGSAMDSPAALQSTAGILQMTALSSAPGNTVAGIPTSWLWMGGAGIAALFLIGGKRR
jgi:hypothetical protein